MENKINIIQPEIQIEQIFSYSIQGHEALKLAKREIKSGYNFSLIPNGSHIYTGILQTTGHMMLDKSKDGIIFIGNQNKNPSKIEIYNQKIGPILGLNFEGTTFITKDKIFLQSKDMPDELEFQLNIARIINNSQKYIYFGLGSEINEKELEKFLKKISKYKDFYNFVFLSNLTEQQEIKQCKSLDTEIIKSISIGKKVTKEIIQNKALYGFVRTSKTYDKEPEVVMYANSGDLDGNTKNTNGYICMVF